MIRTVFMRFTAAVATFALLLAACSSSNPETGQLVVLNGEDLTVIDDDGSNPTPISVETDGPFFQPIWSPDGSHVAFSRPSSDAALFVVELRSGASDSVSTDTVPFYFSWSQDNRLAMLRNGSDGLRLDIVSVNEGSFGVPTTAATGQPLYFGWSPDGSELAAHIGTDQLLISDVADSAPLGVTPGLFQTPRWTDQGIISVEQGNREQRLTVANRDGTSNPIARVSGRSTFVSNQDGSLVAMQSISDETGTSVAFQQLPRVPANRLAVVNVASGESESVTDAPALAYFWSPQGDRLLVLDVVAGQQARWQVWEDGELTELVRFGPEPSFIRDMVPFFDQYAQSLSLWSPDGTKIAFPGVVGDEAGIWVQSLGGEPVKIADGTWVSWAP